MLLAKLEPEGSEPVTLIVLEPANLVRLRLGQPIVRNLAELTAGADLSDPATPKLPIIIAFTPDPEWVTEQVAAGKHLLDAVRDSYDRPDVVRASSVERRLVHPADTTAGPVDEALQPNPAEASPQLVPAAAVEEPVPNDLVDDLIDGAEEEADRRNEASIG